MKAEAELSARRRAKELVAQMTLEEKVFQTLHNAPMIERLGVKAYNYWNEGLHGVARAGVSTVFPQAIGMAAMFDEDLMEDIAGVIAEEGRAKFNVHQKFGDCDIYKGLTFWAPNINIFRDPRWGRGHETYGEDPYLTSRLAVRYIKGIQGNDGNYLKAAACVKHFAVHSGPEALRHSFNAEVSEQDLWETYLPAFKACVTEAKVEAVMGAYNRVNGEPCCASEKLMVEILRNKWNFQGHVTSDCWAIKDFHEHHGVTSTPQESAALAMNRGCDLNCGNLYIYLLQAVKEGLIKEEAITRAVERLMITRYKLGLFEEESRVPYRDFDYLTVDCREHQELNLTAAKKSLVLLKNEGQILPLNRDSIKTIGIIGPNANNRAALVGNYEGTASDYSTVLEGIKEYLGQSVRVLYAEGCHLCKNRMEEWAVENDRISEVLAVAEKSDVLIACMGMDASIEGEGGDIGNEYGAGDKKDLCLPGLQEQVLQRLVECGKPVVLVYLAGSALIVPSVQEKVKAIIHAWYPGAQGGRALAQLIFGEYSPEGKLPVTLYKTTEELPDFCDYSMIKRTYRYMQQDAMYPFGFGLSYTKFEIGDIKLSSHEISWNGEIICTCTLHNTGDYDGWETIQLYVGMRNMPGAPKYQLKNFKKIFVAAHSLCTVSMTLKADAFALYNQQGELVLNQGEYDVYIGTHQPDRRSEYLTGTKVYSECIICRETYIEDATCGADMQEQG